MKKSTFINRESGIQFIKFSLVGLLNTGLHYFVFISLFSLVGLNYLVSSTLGYGVGLINSFLLNRKWTFLKNGGPIRVEFGRFVIVNLSALAINLGVLKYLVETLKIQPEISQLVAIAFSLSINFLGNKFWTFQT